MTASIETIAAPLALALPLQGRVLVEASAGTGKTYTLVGLVVRLVVEGGLMPDQILVVTYTRAATAELRGRIRERMTVLRRALAEDDCSAGDDPLLATLCDRLRADDAQRITAVARLDAALAGLERAAIETIHAFCQRALAEGAFNRGTAFEAVVEPLPGTMRQELVRDLWRRATASEVAEAFWPEEHHARLARDVFEHDKLADWQKVSELALSWPDAELTGAARPDDAPTLDEDGSRDAWLRHGRRSFADIVRTTLPQRMRDAGLHDFDGLVRALRDALVQQPSLARELARRHSALLIDESQDTDGSQLEVFETIHTAAVAHDRDRALLVLVGDPKQAIYAFRGADLHNFLRVALTFDDRRTLLENRRSHPDLVAAVDALIASPTLRNAAALRMPDLDYGTPVGAGRKPLVIDTIGDRPLTVLIIDDGSDKPMNDDAAVAGAIADDIVRLLSDPAATLGGKAVQPSDIAVLVSNREEGAAVRSALADRRVPVASTTRSSVFMTPEADELRRFMRALCDLADERRVRAALAGRLVGFDAAMLGRLDHDIELSDHWRSTLADWAERWHRDGFGAAVRLACAECRTWERLAAAPGGERSMTNLLHLLQLLDGTGIQDPDALLLWLRRQDGSSSSATIEGDDPALLQIDSDGRQVRVMTMHAAKGLEFPIVYLGGIGGGRAPRDSIAPLHHAAGHPAIDFDASPASQAAEDSDELDQAMRVAYVGLTRAESRAYVVWGPFAAAERSPLGWWLGDGTQAMTAAAVWSALASLAQRASGVGVREVELADETPRRWSPPATDTNIAPIALATLSRPVPAADRRASFTALVAQGVSPDEPDHDQAIDDAAVEPAPASAELRFRFERGAAAGVCVHAIAETIDWHGASGDWLDVIRRELARSAIEGVEPKDMAVWLDEIRRAPIAVPGVRPFALADIDASDWHREVAFDLPLRDADFSRVAAAALAAGVAVPALPTQHWRGLLRGYIDALVVHDGRVFVLDWKSNHLGDRLTDYGDTAMEAEMRLHGYHLQHLLYSVAVRRFLASRGSKAAFGGVIYGFMRGMSPEAPGHGVVALAPNLALLDALDALLT